MRAREREQRRRELGYDVLRWLGVLVAIAAVVLVFGCASTFPQTLDTIGRLSPAARTALVAAYEHDPRPTDEADRAWAPVFMAWDRFAEVHSVCAARSECAAGNAAACVEAQYQPPCDVEALRPSACALAAVLPDDVGELRAVVRAVCEAP